MTSPDISSIYIFFLNVFLKLIHAFFNVITFIQMNPQITVYKSDLKKRKEKEKKFYLARSENLVN